MRNPRAIADAVATAPTWNARIALVRRVPEEFGLAQHAAVYASIAKLAYVPTLQSNSAYIHWRSEYELPALSSAYESAYKGTSGFAEVGPEHLASVLAEHPDSLRIFRLLLGFTIPELAETCRLVASRSGLTAVSDSLIDSTEKGRGIRPNAAETLAAAIFLHQRAYGGAFRQLLDATSGQRGDLVEEPVAELFREAGVPYVRTGAHNQAAIERRWGLTVRPAPDFVVYDRRTDTLRAILECKGASDGGTARDKASRFAGLRAEAQRLGGVPVFAVLEGNGWRRTKDALGPVVRDTDGRVFTLATLSEMIETEPFPSLRGLADPDQFAR